MVWRLTPLCIDRLAQPFITVIYSHLNQSTELTVLTENKGDLQTPTPGELRLAFDFDDLLQNGQICKKLHIIYDNILYHGHLVQVLVKLYIILRLT